jgi:hypothetical protein
MHTVRPDDLAIQRQNSAHRGANSDTLSQDFGPVLCSECEFVCPKMPLANISLCRVNKRAYFVPVWPPHFPPQQSAELFLKLLQFRDRSRYLL